ncbi:MAG: ATP-binding cassette domain-containing protein [Verrucomicrobiota bacterium]
MKTWSGFRNDAIPRFRPDFAPTMIEVSNLQKQFGSKVAVKNVSFSVEKGEVLGFLGPNGAGKSTTMRMITGYLTPTEGQVKVAGISVHEAPEEAKRRIGYLPESAPLYPDMTVSGFLKFCAGIRGLKGEEKTSAVDRALATCFLQPVRDQSIDTLSKGYRHRTCLAQALLHDPEILILDEPTDGLDPNQKREVRQLIREMGRDKAIIFSTHILEEVEAACSRAIIIDSGRIKVDSTPGELLSRSPEAGRIRAKLSGSKPTPILAALKKLPSARAVETFEQGEDWVSVILDPTQTKDNQLVVELAELAREKGLRLADLQVEAGRLDAVFRKITTSETGE